MYKRQNIFQSPEVRINKKNDQPLKGILVLPQSPTNTEKQPNQIQLLNRSHDNNQNEINKDQVRPSSKPNIRQMKQPSQNKDITSQSLQSQSIKPFLQNASATNIIQSPNSAASNGNMSGQIVMSRTSLQSPPRINKMSNIIQQQLPQQGNKCYQRCCPSHSDECLKRICSIPYCNKDILLCGDCMYEDPDHTKIHQQDIMLVNDFLDIVEREGQKHNWKTLLEQQQNLFSPTIQNLSQFPVKHAKEYAEYIEEQKKKINHDINIISQLFQQYLLQIQNEMIESLNNQLQHVCQQLEILKMEVKNTQEIDQSVFINPRGYLENQLLFNENMEEVSHHFRWVRDILFGENLTIQNQKARKQQIDQMGEQLIKLLKSPPEYTTLTKETLKEIEKRISQQTMNLTGEMRFSLLKDPNQLTKTNPFQLTYFTDQMKSSLNINKGQQMNDYASFGLIQSQQGNQGSQKLNPLQASQKVMHMNSQDSNNFSKEYFINKLLDSGSKANGILDSQYNQSIFDQAQQKQSIIEYDYTKDKPKLITLADSDQKIFIDQLEDKVKQSSNKITSNLQVMKKDEEQPFNNFNQSNVNQPNNNNNNATQNRTNNFMSQESNKINNTATIKTKSMISNQFQQSPFQKPENNQMVQSLANIQNGQKIDYTYKEYGNQFYQNTPNIDELQAVTPNSNVTPIKPNSNKEAENRRLSSQQKLQLNPNEQQQQQLQSLQPQNSYEGSWYQVQTVLETIPEVSSVNHGQGQDNDWMNINRSDNKNNNSNNIDIMEGNKCINVNGLDKIKIDDLGQDVQMDGNSAIEVNCLCVINNTVIACGDASGTLKLYTLQTSYNSIKQCTPHKFPISCITCFQTQTSFIVSGSTKDSLIHLWNIIDDKQNISLRDSQIQLPSSFSKPQTSSQNTNFISSFYDERNLISVINNFSGITIWDVKEQKKVQTIKPIVQAGDQSSSQVTSILCLGKAMQSILIGYKCCKVGIYKVDYVNQIKYNSDSNKIQKVTLLKQVDLGKGNIPSTITSLFNNKIFITVKKSIFVWDTKTFELSEKIESYQNDISSTNSAEIADILLIQLSNGTKGHAVIQTCKNDNRIIIQNPNSSIPMKYHIKDFKITDSVFKNKLQFCRNSLNELLIIALNQNKNSITYWKLFDHS